MLLDNDYLLDLIFNKINSRLKKLFVQRTKTATATTNEVKDINSNSERKTLVLP